MNFNSQKLSNSLPHQSQTKPHQTQPHEKTIFGSRVNRFAFNPKDTPGPGTYEFNIKEKHTQDFRVVKEREGMVAPQHQWIFSSGRFSIPTSNAFVGPGLYHSEKTESMDLSHSNWPKRQRFNETIRFKNSLGPGQYHEQVHKNKNSNLAVFKSKSPRTFFEEMALKQQKAGKKNNPQDLDDKQQIVKFQQTAYPIRKKVQKLSSVFLSKCTRPELINQQQSSSKLGPGSYSLNEMKSPAQKSTTAILSAIHYNASPKDGSKKAVTLVSKIAPPGPGAYQAETLLESIKRPLGIITKQQRFKTNSIIATKQKLPGPGQYMQNRYTMINQDEVLFKNKKKGQKVHDFGTAARTTLRNKNDAPFGQYNVQLFDMNYKLLKQKQHYQKLRMMEVTLPAFNSKKHQY